MRFVSVVVIVTCIYLLIQNQFSDKYEQGYADGLKNALRTNPPSQDLEMVCAGLWMGQQNKKYWEKSK